MKSDKGFKKFGSSQRSTLDSPSKGGNEGSRGGAFFPIFIFSKSSKVTRLRRTPVRRMERSRSLDDEKMESKENAQLSRRG